VPLPSTTVAITLQQALNILRDDSLVAYHRVVSEIDGIGIDFNVDGESFQLRGARHDVRFDTLGPGPEVFIRTSRRTVIALIDGKADMMDCLLAGRLAVQAEVTLLPRLSRACVAFSEGAIRSRNMRALLATFRASIRLDQSLRSIM
jgi:hypothetical protein